MRSPGFLLALALFVVSVPARGEEEPIADPVKHVLATYAHNPGSKLLRLKADLTGSGGKVVFLSYRDDADRSGNLWLAFAPVEGGYRRVPVIEADGKRNEKGAVRFRTDAFFVGFIKESGSNGLATYHPGGGGEGVLGAIIFQGDALKEINLGVLHPREGADEGRYEELFGRPGASRIEELPVP